jgi:hypothetical protein
MEVEHRSATYSRYVSSEAQTYAQSAPSMHAFLASNVVRVMGSRNPPAIPNPAPAGNAIHITILNLRAISRDGRHDRDVAEATGGIWRLGDGAD